jgi:hypothetical protein
MRRGLASYDDRPYADMVVFNDSGQWFVRLAGKALGPCSSSEDAVKAAIETAQLAERHGKTTRVRIQTGTADFETVWPSPAKKQERVAKLDNETLVKIATRRTSATGGWAVILHTLDDNVGQHHVDLADAIVCNLKRSGYEIVARKEIAPTP